MKKNIGFTLIEIIIAVSLVGAIILLSSGMVISSFKTQKISYDDYDIQNSIRIATIYTNKIINESSAIFTIQEGRFREDNLSEGWDYYGISDDKTQIVKYIYDSSLIGPSKHKREVLVDAKEGITYEYTFRRPVDNKKKNYINYTIEVYKDGSPVANSKIQTELEAKNSKQVVYRDTMTRRAVAIATRSDLRPHTQITTLITFVLDNSGSMADPLDNRFYASAHNPSRMTLLKNAAKNIIDEFSLEKDIDISIIPFSTTANCPNPTKADSLDEHGYFNVASSDNISNLKDSIDNMKSLGGTNTGDGLRRAYYSHQQYKDVYVPATYPRGTRVYHYLIFLADGDTNTSSYKMLRPNNPFNLGYAMFDDRGPFNYMKPISIAGYQWRAYYNPGLGSYSIYENLSLAIPYRNYFANKIKDYNVKSYCIGFTANDEAGVRDTAYYLGTEDKNTYVFNTPGFNLDLDDVFKDIKKDILDGLWHIKGPAE